MNLARRLYSGNPGFDLRPLWPRLAAVSGLFVLLCVGSLVARGLELGIEFEGGGVWEVESEDLSIEEARDALRPSGNDDARIQVLTTGTGTRTIRVQGGTEAFDDSEVITDALADAAGVSPSEISINTVGRTWVDEITSEAQLALVLFLIAITIYISVRLEWKMAVGAVVAVAHDILVTVGIYSIFQFQVTPATVIAFLTILGYSLYDTVVVFDKLREMRNFVGVSTRMTYTDMANHATNEVLMRSVNTSITSLLPVVSMLVVGSWFMGATTLQDFAIALAVGLLVGAYSSLFVAVPVVVALKEREAPNAEVRERIGVRGERPVRPPVGQGANAPGTSAAAPRADVPRPATTGRTHPPRPRKKGKRR